MDLLDLVDQYTGKLQQNPPLDYGVRVNQFVDAVQSKGQDLSQWGEDEWRAALEKLGVPDEAVFDMLENVASWGVVDNYVWE